MSFATRATTCAHGPCGKRLRLPFLQCSNCKKKMYCSKVCQKAAWKAGHKHDCITAETPLTLQQKRLTIKLDQLRVERNWHGVVALDEEARACAREMQGQNVRTRAWILNLLGIAARETADYARALELHSEYLAMAAAQGNRGEVAAACSSLGLCYDLTGNNAKAREMHQQHRAICEALGDGAGVARACDNLGNTHSWAGDYARAVELHQDAMALCKQLGDRAGEARVSANLGKCYRSTAAYAQARQLYEQHRAICEEIGDRTGVATACGNLGSVYNITGNYSRARELHEEQRALFEALGNDKGLASAYNGLGLCYDNMGHYAHARELHEKDRAICEALEDRSGVGTACANLGCSFERSGDYMMAQEFHEKGRAICEELGDRRGVAIAHGNLGCCFHRMREYERAHEMHEQHKAMAEALGDRVGVARACWNIGLCHISTGDYTQALGFLTKQYKIGREIQVARHQGDAALAIGALLRVQLDVSSCDPDEVQKALHWLKIAVDFDKNEAAHLHLARLYYGTRNEHLALAHLGDYLSLYIKDMDVKCAGCQQSRGENVNLLICSGCRVARFCSKQHQKMASDSSDCSSCLVNGKHSTVCALLGKWRHNVVKRGRSPDSMREHLLAFLSE